MVLVSRLARKGLIDSIVRQGRIQFIIWLQTVFSLLPQLLRFVILISLEALYNVYQHLNGLGPRSEKLWQQYTIKCVERQ